MALLTSGSETLSKLDSPRWENRNFVAPRGAVSTSLLFGSDLAWNHADSETVGADRWVQFKDSGSSTFTDALNLKIKKIGRSKSFVTEPPVAQYLLSDQSAGDQDLSSLDIDTAFSQFEAIFKE